MPQIPSMDVDIAFINSRLKLIQADPDATTYLIGNKRYRRIPYGKEGGQDGKAAFPCHDCGVTEGKLHVPGCDVESCPRCRTQQAIFCPCPYEDNGKRA